MSRIRSVHPGLFTDETFVSLSDAAQIFYVGLWTEADDQGLFEWKPLTLKMRLRPCSNSPVDPLLDELIAGNAIKRIMLNGKAYGAIRNFRKYQKPKYPNAVHPIDDDTRKYVALCPAIPETECVQRSEFPQNGEKSALLEGGVEDEEESPLPPKGDFDEFWNLYPEKVEEGPARIAYDQATNIVSHETIIAGLRRSIARKPKTQAWKKPALWLDKRRWDDYPEPKSPKVVSFPASGGQRSYAEIRAERVARGELPPDPRQARSATQSDTVLIEVEGHIS